MLCPNIVNKDYALKDLYKYVSTPWRSDKCPIGGLLEKTIIAIEAGATPADLRKTLKDYLPDRSGHDPTYG